MIRRSEFTNMNSTRRFEKQSAEWTKFNTENKETFVIKRPKSDKFNRNNQKGNKEIKFTALLFLSHRRLTTPVCLRCCPCSWGWWRVRTAALPSALRGWRSTRRWPVCRREPQCRAGAPWSSGCRTGNPVRDQQSRVRKSCTETLRWFVIGPEKSKLLC